MNPRYLETFNRHRGRYLVPVVLAGILALWMSLGAPKLYRSQTSLWSDTAGGSGAEAIGATPPAAQDQSILNELLTTRYFVHNVARLSPLQAYLEQHQSEGWGPTAMLSKLRAAPTLDERIAAALSPKRVTAVVRGPHVLEISYDATTPELAVKTLRVLVQQFRKQRAALLRDALTVAQQQVLSASKALGAARTNLNEYIRQHPGSSSADPELSSLAGAERDAVTQLANATQTFNQASTAVLNGASFANTLRVVDPPRLPIGPSTGKKHMLMSLVAGLFAGALISILGIVILTKTAQPQVPAQPAVPIAEAVPHPIPAPNGAHAALAHPPPPAASAKPSHKPQARPKKTHLQ
jgi:uncharacterized protein involved in exopolysaccharide biosynthesis